MKTRTLTFMLLLLATAGVASADESMDFQNRGAKEADKYQAWSRDWKSPTLGTAAVARVTEDVGHEVVAKSRYVNGSSSAKLGTAPVARVTEDVGHGGVVKSHEASHGSRSPALEAPEIDATALIVGLTLLVGALAVLRGRRAANSPAG